MGKWRNRPIFRQRRSSRSPPTFYDLQAPLPEFWQDGIPLWEKKFCTLVGLVPWQKIIDSKKFMNCHSNVLNWNDSAAEEAFQNAKRQYWAKINSLPCDIPLPDSDTYVDQIDWNPYIDPELIKELDHVYFAPPEEEERNAVNYKRTKISANGENSWECDVTELDKSLENKVQGWNQCEWDNHKDGPDNSENACNPWGYGITRENGGLTDNAWEGGGANLWGWNQVSGHNNRFRYWGCGYNPWQNDCLGIPSQKNNKGWGKVWDNSWKPKQTNNLSNIDRPWECNSNQHNRAPVGRGWRNCEENSPGWKQQRNANFSGDSQFRGKCSDWTSRNQSFQKGESYHQSTVGYNSSRFQRDDHQKEHYWRRENSKKRVSFVCE